MEKNKVTPQPAWKKYGKIVVAVLGIIICWLVIWNQTAPYRMDARMCEIIKQMKLGNFAPANELTWELYNQLPNTDWKEIQYQAGEAIIAEYPNTPNTFMDAPANVDTIYMESSAGSNYITLWATASYLDLQVLDTQYNWVDGELMVKRTIPNGEFFDVHCS